MCELNVTVGPSWPLTRKTFVGKSFVVAMLTASDHKFDCESSAIPCIVCKLCPEIMMILSTMFSYSVGK